MEIFLIVTKKSGHTEGRFLRTREDAEEWIAKSGQPKRWKVVHLVEAPNE